MIKIFFFYYIQLHVALCSHCYIRKNTACCFFPIPILGTTALVESKVQNRQKGSIKTKLTIFSNYIECSQTTSELDAIDIFQIQGRLRIVPI